MALMVAAGVLRTDAVFHGARAIVERVQQLMLGEQSECAEESRAVDSGKHALEVAKRKGVVEIEQGAPDHDAYGRGADIVVLQVLGYQVIHSSCYSLSSSSGRMSLKYSS